MKLEHYPVDKLKEDVLKILKKYLNLSKYKVFFFGSRVSGTCGERSDIDIGIEGPQVSPHIKLEIKEELENLPTLYKVDFVDFNDVDEDFKRIAKKYVEYINIDKNAENSFECVNSNASVFSDFMFEDLLKKFESALRRFEEILQKEKSEIVRDSAIKRFEICFDLAWKTLKAYLYEYLKVECYSPKSCFKLAYQEKIIDYDEYWMKIIDLRNQSVHIYSEDLADKIYDELHKVLEYMKKLFFVLKLNVE
jgi:nucleotidyltransferase substrate binding protein (TIGR01987 family)